MNVKNINAWKEKISIIYKNFENTDHKMRKNNWKNHYIKYS